jgi:glycosyltransferase involved in cell wall biosynthesis
MAGPRSICFYTPSAEPSGMGAHMLDLIAAFAGTTDVSLMVRRIPKVRWMLERAAELGARTLALPSPRDPQFGALITDFLVAHPADVFHCHVGTGSENWNGVRLGRAAGCPVVLQTQHLPYALSSPRRRQAYFRSIAQVDRLIAVSAGLRRTYERIGVPAELLTTVANGIAPLNHRMPREEARRAMGLDPEQPVVLTVGRLTHMKAQWQLVDVVPDLVSRFPGLVIMLLGDGPLREVLAKQAAGLGMAHVVRFPGHRPDARQLLAAADVFLLSSRYEGMPLAVLEAMEAGLPVVATRVVGNEDVVVDGVTGTLVPFGRPAALGAALAALLDDPGLRRRQGAAGRCRYLAGFTRERMAAETAAIYEELLQAVSRPAVTAG